MPSRQERRKAERDAAKRAPGQAGAGGAGGAAAARANVIPNPVGDWTTQASDPAMLFRALGADVIKHRACAGDREAQWSWGFWLVREADGGAGTKLGEGGRSPKADVGFPLAPHSFPGSHQTPTRRCGQLLTKSLDCRCRPWVEEGTALLEKAAGQGHAYAMYTLGNIHALRNEDEEAVEWYTKGAEAGLPRAMCSLGFCLDTGEGVAAPNHPAAADWFRRAADAGSGEAASNLSNMYTLGRGGARQIIPATSSATF